MQPINLKDDYYYNKVFIEYAFYSGIGYAFGTAVSLLFRNKIRA
jgi:hypothetical protein